LFRKLFRGDWPAMLNHEFEEVHLDRDLGGYSDERLSFVAHH
jgi:hypothetical protein